LTPQIALLKKHEKRLQTLHYDTPGIDAQETHDLLSLLEDLHDRMMRLKKHLEKLDVVTRPFCAQIDSRHPSGGCRTGTGKGAQYGLKTRLGG
jgi:hypothetical protein